jgi:ubiquinol-cytochrome c reductase cytochrome b subunit
METGTIVRLPQGEYIELHRPLPAATAYLLTAHERRTPAEAGADANEHGIPAPGRRRRRLRAAASRFYFGSVVQKPTRKELEAAHAHQRGHGAGREAAGGSAADGPAAGASGEPSPT